MLTASPARPSPPIDRDLGKLGERAAYWLHVADRQVIYLDTDVWVLLSRAEDTRARDCRARCEEAVRAKQAIFPLSYASFSELVQQIPSPSRHSRMEFMQDLSEGVAFRDLDSVRHVEAAAAFPLLLGEPAMSIDISLLFAGVGECIQDAAAAWHEEGGPPDEVIARLRRDGYFNSLEQIVRVADEAGHYRESKDFHEECRSRLGEAIIKAADACRSSDGKISRDRALLKEQAAMFSYIVPLLRDEILKLPAVLVRRVSELAKSEPGGSDRLRRFLPSMPSVANEAEILARRVMQPDRPHKGRNDFWDVAHGTVPSAYSHAWVTFDGELASIVRACSAPKARGCQILANMGELRDWMAQQLS